MDLAAAATVNVELDAGTAAPTSTPAADWLAALRDCVGAKGRAGALWQQLGGTANESLDDCVSGASGRNPGKLHFCA